MQTTWKTNKLVYISIEKNAMIDTYTGLKKLAEDRVKRRKKLNFKEKKVRVKCNLYIFTTLKLFL